MKKGGRGSRLEIPRRPSFRGQLNVAAFHFHSVPAKVKAASLSRSLRERGEQRGWTLLVGARREGMPPKREGRVSASPLWKLL